MPLLSDLQWTGKPIPYSSRWITILYSLVPKGESTLIMPGNVYHCICLTMSEDQPMDENGRSKICVAQRPISRPWVREINSPCSKWTHMLNSYFYIKEGWFSSIKRNLQETNLPIELLWDILFVASFYWKHRPAWHPVTVFKTIVERGYFVSMKAFLKVQ